MSKTTISTILIVIAMLSFTSFMIYDSITNKSFSKIEPINFKYLGQITRGTTVHSYLKEEGINSNELTEYREDLTPYIDSESNVILYRHYYNFDNSFFKIIHEFALLKDKNGHFTYISIKKHAKS